MKTRPALHLEFNKMALGGTARILPRRHDGP
jgi:hypothetical protein